ncbi:MAG: TIGR04086 family membrane protein [Massiliimalia sp.]
MLISIAAGGIVMIVLMLLFSVFVMNTDHQAVIILLATISALAGTAVAGFLTGMAYRKDKLFMGIVSGIGMCLVLLVLNLLFFREPLSVWSIVKYILMIAVAAAMTFLVKTGRKRKIKH